MIVTLTGARRSASVAERPAKPQPTITTRCDVSVAIDPPSPFGRQPGDRPAASLACCALVASPFCAIRAYTTPPSSSWVFAPVLLSAVHRRCLEPLLNASLVLFVLASRL